MGYRIAHDAAELPSMLGLQGLRQVEWRPGPCCHLLAARRQLLARPLTAVAEGSRILRAMQEGAQAQLGFEQAKERWFGRRACTLHGNSISQEFVKPRFRI